MFTKIVKELKKTLLINILFRKGDGKILISEYDQKNDSLIFSNTSLVNCIRKGEK